MTLFTRACQLLMAMTAVPLASAAAARSPEVAELPASALAAVRANGVQLHYVDRGQGVPIVFIHGGLADYREWAPVADALPTGFRTVTYSRRHSFPNNNARPGSIIRCSGTSRTRPD